MRRHWPWAVVVLIPLLAFGWLRSHDAKVRAEARVEAVRDSLSREVVAARAEIVRVDSVAKDSINVLAHQRGTAERVRTVYVDRERVAVVLVAEAGANTDATVDSLARVVPVEVRPVVDTLKVQLSTERGASSDLAAALRGQVGALTESLRTADARDGLRLGQIAARDSLEVRRVAQVSGLEDALAKAGCSKWCTVKKVAIGVGIGYGLKVAESLLKP